MANVASSTKITHQESVGSCIGYNAGTDRHFHHSHRLSELVGLAEIVEELSGLGSIRLLAFVQHHGFKVEEGIIEPELFASLLILLTTVLIITIGRRPPIGESENSVFS
ncbi:hypothetical protein TIFTF001_034714 [Ficus carica]|uniref:Uncharacterized protein n=1 Tax=Ficus carica TaxID=3494 RepID=A0AA88E0V4_FICCA|nr:hypothetical protein TIFTF001_034714 [Ficus carica]